MYTFKNRTKSLKTGQSFSSLLSTWKFVKKVIIFSNFAKNSYTGLYVFDHKIKIAVSYEAHTTVITLITQKNKNFFKKVQSQVQGQKTYILLIFWKIKIFSGLTLFALHSVSPLSKGEGTQFWKFQKGGGSLKKTFGVGETKRGGDFQK